MKRFLTAVAAFSAAAWAGYAQEILREGDASYASYTPWSKARTFGADGKVVRRDEQRITAGNSLSIVYDFPGLLPCWAAPREEAPRQGTPPQHGLRHFPLFPFRIRLAKQT